MEHQHSCPVACPQWRAPFSSSPGNCREFASAIDREGQRLAPDREGAKMWERWRHTDRSVGETIGTLLIADDELHVLVSEPPSLSGRMGGSRAICMTAVHSFQHARKIKQSREPNMSYLSPDRRPSGSILAGAEGDRPVLCHRRKPDGARDMQDRRPALRRIAREASLQRLTLLRSK